MRRFRITCRRHWAVEPTPDIWTIEGCTFSDSRFAYVVLDGIMPISQGFAYGDTQEDIQRVAVRSESTGTLTAESFMWLDDE